MTDIGSRLMEAGYRPDGRNEAGRRFRRGEFTVYHSGHVLLFIRGRRTARPFPEDRLLSVPVEELERQTGVITRPFDGREDGTSYEILRRF